MNREWMRERLESFKALCEAYDLENRRVRYAEFTDRHRDITDQMSSQMPTVREILKRLDPALAEQVELPSMSGGTSSSRGAVQQGLGILRDRDEWAANLAPDAPTLIADQFHPYVWTAASPLWDTGQYRVAVGQASVSLSAHIAKKAASPLSERDLVNQVLAPGEPGPNQVRLHFAGDKSSKTWKSRQEGLHLLAQGAFAGIRNVATHTGDEWTEQVALEHLAILSVVARWADETEVITGSETPRQPQQAGRSRPCLPPAEQPPDRPGHEPALQILAHPAPAHRLVVAAALASAGHWFVPSSRALASSASALAAVASSAALISLMSCCRMVCRSLSIASTASTASLAQRRAWASGSFLAPQMASQVLRSSTCSRSADSGVS
jgi:hypothetical protein